MSGWQPIDSAPRDEKPIWIATEYRGHGTGFMEPVRSYRHGWINIYLGSPIEWNPTHWMPLPNPPANIEQAG